MLYTNSFMGVTILSYKVKSIFPQRFRLKCPIKLAYCWIKAVFHYLIVGSKQAYWI